MDPVKATRENLAVVEHLYAALQARDYDAFRRICAEDITWIQNEGFPGGGTWRGAEAIVENVFKSFKREWDGWKFEIEQYLDAGETIIVLGRYAGTYRESGKPMSAAAAHVYDVAKGKISRFRQYTDTFSIIRAMEKAQAPDS